MWDLNVSVPDDCLPFYTVCVTMQGCEVPRNILITNDPMNI